MVSADGRYVIAFNGEIYNYRELRRELPPPARALRGHSDTEVLLEACARGASRRRSSASSACSRSPCGTAPAHADAGARPARHQAALLRRAAGPPAVRLGAEGVARASRTGGRPSTRRGRGLSAPQLRPATAHDLSRGREAAARDDPDGARGRGAGADLLLGRARRSRAPACTQRSGAGRDGGGRAARCAAARCRPAAHDRRRAARRLSLRRHRFLDRGGADAGAEHAAGEDVLDRLSRRGLRRGGACQGRRRAPAHRAHRTLRRAAARARS